MFYPMNARRSIVHGFAYAIDRVFLFDNTLWKTYWRIRSATKDINNMEPKKQQKRKIESGGQVVSGSMRLRTGINGTSWKSNDTKKN